MVCAAQIETAESSSPGHRERAAGLARMCLAALVLGAISLLAGCGVLGKPSANIVDAKLSDLSLEGVTVALKVDVKNPYPVAVPLTNVEYSLASKQESILTGSLTNPGSIPARGS